MRKKKTLSAWLVLTIAINLFSCKSGRNTSSLPNSINEKNQLLREGVWRMALQIKGRELPFQFTVNRDENGDFKATFLNGTEKITSLPLVFKGDSLFFRPPVFDCEFSGTLQANNRFSGVWTNYYKSKDYRISFYAEQGDLPRFKPSALAKSNETFGGKWEVWFNNGGNPEKAIGVFTQMEDGRAFGTFMTETGDYRFLEGNVYGDSLFLSCFDGSHAFLFEAKKEENGELKGAFYSGIHWKDSWSAKRNENASLSDPDSLTYLLPGYETIAFSFPDLNGNQVTFPSGKFKNKVTIIQIMGSWCPNCMDETRFLSDIYNKYNDLGLEIVALCYEKSSDFEFASNAVSLHKKDLDAPYDFLIAGRADKKSASKTLPMLNHIMSFPTTIYLDRSGRVRKIYTGFYGPGTGNYYYQFVETTTSFIEKLLEEKP